MKIAIILLAVAVAYTSAAFIELSPSVGDYGYGNRILYVREENGDAPIKDELTKTNTRHILRVAPEKVDAPAAPLVKATRALLERARQSRAATF